MRRAAWLGALALTACAAPTAPPGSAGRDPFYTQNVFARGIPIVASPRVSPRALAAAQSMMGNRRRGGGEQAQAGSNSGGR